METFSSTSSLWRFALFAAVRARPENNLSHQMRHKSKHRLNYHFSDRAFPQKDALSFSHLPLFLIDATLLTIINNIDKKKKFSVGF